MKQPPIRSIVQPKDISSSLLAVKNNPNLASIASQSVSIPQDTSLWNWASSFFRHHQDPELKVKGLDGVLYEILYPDHEQTIIDRAGLTRNIRSFDQNDLEKAKTRINNIIESDPRYKTSLVEENKFLFGTKKKKSFFDKDLRSEQSLFRMALWDLVNWDFKKVNELFKGTILDEVLYKAFSGEDSIRFYTTVDNVLNYINLAEWLISKGVKTISENQEKYVAGYEALMKAYKELYKPQDFRRRTLTILDEDSFKKIFIAFDALL